MRPGLNSVARLGGVLASISAVLFLALAALGYAEPRTPVWIFQLGLTLAFLASLAAVSAGIRALGQVRIHGGRGAALRAIVLGAIFALILLLVGIANLLR